jgi:helicase MOV-10
MRSALCHLTGILGDAVLAKTNDYTDDKWYEGHVHYVHETEVGLRFHHSFQKVATQLLDVRFQVNRVTLRRQHQALCAEHHATNLLFPPTHVAELSEIPITLIDPKIESNSRQLRAIKQILSSPSTSAPYIIFGP